MANLKNILRTCIICRNKFEQKELLRFRCKEKKIIFYDNFGRSFYICENCKETILSDMKTKDLKRIEKTLNRQCKNNDNYVIQLKEMLTNVR